MAFASMVTIDNNNFDKTAVPNAFITQVKIKIASCITINPANFAEITGKKMNTEITEK